MVARRASLEDDLAALAEVEGLDFGDLMGEQWAAMRLVVERVASLATGRLQILREIRELDDRLGLTPKAMAALRWKIVDDPEPEKAVKAPKGVTDLGERRRRLVDAS